MVDFKERGGCSGTTLVMRGNLRMDCFLVLESFKCVISNIWENLRTTKLKEKVLTKNKGGRFLGFGGRIS